MRKSRIYRLLSTARAGAAGWSRKVRFAAVMMAGLSAGVGQWDASGEASAKCLGGACHFGHRHHFATRQPIVFPYCGPVVLPYCAPALVCAPTVRVVRVSTPACAPCSPVRSVPVRVVYRPVASCCMPAPTYGCGSATRVVKVVRVKKVVRVPSCGARVVPSCGQPATRRVVQPGIAQPILPISPSAAYPAPFASRSGHNAEATRLVSDSLRFGFEESKDQGAMARSFQLVSFSEGFGSGTGRGINLAADEELPAPAIRVERAKPGISPLRPGEGVWDESAVGILDDLVRRGEFAAALQSCESMSTNSQGMSKGVSLRHAVLKLFAPESESELSAVLDLLNTACAAGSNLRGEELGGGTLRGFLEATPVSLDESLNQFSRLTLENPRLAVGNLLLISALLKLDGQEARARIFAEEAFDRASQTGELNWSSLMMTLRRS
ncbi:hypothetical protein SH501x_004759 [Pirellulaceae bacterium SH501]